MFRVLPSLVSVIHETSDGGLNVLVSKLISRQLHSNYGVFNSAFQEKFSAWVGQKRGNSRHT